MTRDQIENQIKKIVKSGTTSKILISKELKIWLESQSVSEVDVTKILNDLESYSSFHNLEEVT